MYIRWLLFKKNTILVRKWLRVIVSMLGTRGVPSLQEPLSMTLKLSKSMWWSNDHECFAMFHPLAHVLTFLICSFLLVSKHRPVSLTWHKSQSVQGILWTSLGWCSIDGLNLGEGNSCCKEFVLVAGWHHWGLFFHLPSSFLCEGGPACFMEDRSRGVKNKILSLVISLVKQIRIVS